MYFLRYLEVVLSKETRPSGPAGAPGGTSKVFVTGQTTNQPTDKTGYRFALAHLKRGLRIQHTRLRNLKGG